MKNTAVSVLEVVERSQHLAAALKTLGYSMLAMKDIDNGEKELREIGWNIEEEIGRLQEYHEKTLYLIEQLNNSQKGAEKQAEIQEIQGKMITRAEASALYEQNAVLLNSFSDAIPFYRVIEIFGEEAAAFIETNMKHNGYLEKDYGGYGIDGESRDNYIFQSGFFKVVAHHNNLIAVENHKKSEGGRIWDKYWRVRCDKLDAADKEADEKEKARKREERKKRAEAKKAKNAEVTADKGEK